MSLHSDILPKRYCDELMRLRSEVAPMPFAEVEEVLYEAYHCPWQEIFSEIEKTPIGSAAIAQVHRARLETGELVVIKVQRKGIYEVMARDIGLLHRAVKLLPPVSIKDMVDLDMVLDELWDVAREEMNFLTEAANMKEFAQRNKEVAFVGVPKLYDEYTNHAVLVMEQIDISNLLSQYGTMDLGETDVAEVMMSLMEVMKENKIIMPHGLTMLARGLTHMEGVLADIAPKINMVEIASRHIAGKLLEEKNWKRELKDGGKNLYRSIHKAVGIPSLVNDILQGYLKGQTKINLDLHASHELERLLRRLVRNVVMGLWVMALLISSSIICTTNMTPKIWGIPALGAFGYLMAFGIVMYVFLKHIFSRK